MGWLADVETTATELGYQVQAVGALYLDGRGFGVALHDPATGTTIRLEGVLVGPETMRQLLKDRKPAEVKP